MGSLNKADFKKLLSQQKTIQMKMRLQALEHFKRGKSRTQITKDLQNQLRQFIKSEASSPTGGRLIASDTNSVN